MKQRNPHSLLPATIFAGSFIALLLTLMLSDPVQNVSFALFFYAILLVLLLSLGHILMSLKSGKVNSKSRFRIVITSVLLVVVLMFRSAGSLYWVDILVLILLGGGLLFYSGRRH